MPNNIKLPEWLKVTLIMGLVLVAGWMTATKKLLIQQNPIPDEKPVANRQTQFYAMQIGSHPLQVEVRKTTAEQDLGLSWRQSMGTNEGMVFVYEQPQRVMYWMKGMNFPLDFIWIRDGKIVGINTHVPAPTKENPVPKTLAPAMEVDTVLEVNAGWVDEHKVSIGDTVTTSY